MTEYILKAADLYATGVKRVLERRAQWLEKHEALKNHLKEIADYLNEHAAYKQGFYIDTLHAFNEEMNGSCADIPSITFRSGDMPMSIKFHNTMGERIEFMEEGFKISFNPTITGQLVVLLLPHHSDVSKEVPQHYTLAIIDNPAELTNDLVDQIITRGMEAAYYSSFTGMGQQKHNESEDVKPVYERAPIGFKRYETTEKVK